MSALNLTPTLPVFVQKIILTLCFEQRAWEKVVYISRRGAWNDEELMYAFGLPDDWVENATPENVRSAKLLLQAHLAQLNNEPFSLSEELDTSYATAEKNIAHLSDILSLTPAEQAVLRLTVYRYLSKPLNDFFAQIKTDLTQLCESFAGLFGLRRSELAQAFHKRSKIIQYGLVDHNTNYGNDDIGDYLKLGDLLEMDDFLNFDVDKTRLLARCVKPCSPPNLTFTDFDYIHAMRDTLRNYLQNVVKTAKKGVNILIYGKPGTGKTELALLLAQAASSENYLLTYEDGDQETISATRRLETCRLAQTLLEGQNAVLIFDEIEDVFSAGLFERSAAQKNKAWVNQFLETNTSPMIWLSNDVRMMDEAFLRRFDFVFEMPDLPLVQKETLIREKIAKNLPAPYVRQFAQHRSLSIALLMRGFELANSLYADLPSLDFAEKCREWFNQTLRAQGFKTIEKPNLYQADYDLAWVNCAEDIAQISAGLKQTRQGRICCFGPAGTGKTAWANWLANELDLPVLNLRGSDLLDPFVGGTEQQIAEAFQQARDNQMVLVLDEVDSFLFDRETAQRSWERTMVNEMLTQIERFEGLLVVSTNLMDSLDPAVLRRFDVKMKFDFLCREQICALARAQAEKLGLTLTDLDFMQLERIRHLALGDFASVARRHRFAPFSTSADWVKALTEEARLKGLENEAKIGFC